MREILFYFIPNEVTFYLVWHEYIRALNGPKKCGCAWLSPLAKYSKVCELFSWCFILRFFPIWAFSDFVFFFQTVCISGHEIGIGGFRDGPVGQHSYSRYIREVAAEVGVTQHFSMKNIRDTVLSEWAHTSFQAEMGVCSFFDLKHE